MNSTSTRLSERVDAALATVRIALGTRPPFPISRPRSSGPTVSIVRPSRGERRSATTIRQIGFFLEPTLVNRIRTAMRRVTLHTPHQLLRVGHLALRELCHQLAHLAELLCELVDRLHSRPRTAGDPLAPRAIDQVRSRALPWSHRQDDRLDAVELALVHVHLAKLLHRRSHPGQHPEDAAERAHTSHLAHLLEEVLEGELLPADLSLEILGLLLVRDLLRLLDQRHDVAHAQDPAGHPLGVEALELVELLPDRRVQDRLARHGLHGERRAAARVAVELRQEHPVEVD